MQRAIDGFSEGFAKSIVEGKSLAVAMRGVARDFAESWIETATKRMIMDELVTTFHTTSNAQAASRAPSQGVLE